MALEHPQEQREVLQALSPQSQEAEALFVLFQQHMDTQHEVIALRHHMLTLPANANVGVTAGITALGKEAVQEGRKARVFPLRFVDGAVFFGPLKVGQVPPLY